MRSLWKEYCCKSTLHGLRYTVEAQLSVYEKISWSLFLTTAAIFVFYHFLACWKLFLSAPTQITVDNPRYPLAEIDFPAVTICPVNKALYSKADEFYQRNYKSHNVDKKRFMNSVLLLSLTRFPFYNHPLEFIEDENYNIYEFPRSHIANIMLNLMPSIDDMFTNCFWRGHRYDCKEILRLQRTEEGFCYSFNSKTAERFSYRNSSRTPPFLDSNGRLIPLRNNAAGKITGFEFTLNSLENEYFPNDRRVKGYNVMIHNPEDFPDVSLNYLIYPQKKKVFRIGITASVVVADSTIKNLSRRQRKCILKDEDHELFEDFLSLQKHTENNCYINCRLRTICEICNCTPYFFQKPAGVDYCGIKHTKCVGILNVAQRNYLAANTGEGFPEWSLPMYMNCTCLPPCSFVTYIPEFRKTYSDIIYYGADNSSSSIYVDIGYKDRYAIRYTRFVKYNVQDLIVSFGGVASLFLGCSIVSFAEFIYYVIRSIIYIFNDTEINWKKWKQQNKSKSIKPKQTPAATNIFHRDIARTSILVTDDIPKYTFMP